MNNFKCITASAIIAIAAFTATAQNSVHSLEQNIKLQEQIVEDKQDSIKDLDSQIKVLKERVDSLNKEEKKVKEQISALEKIKKSHEQGIKAANKLRKEHFSDRDNIIFNTHVADVLANPYNKMDVEDALKHFNGMETKEVLKKKELVENYGKYTKNLREFLEKQKIILSSEGWRTQDPKDEVHKKFMKGLKGTNYWKTYNNSTKSPSIPYLDNVYEQLMQQAANGLANARRFEEIINMLYSNDY